SPAAWIEQCVGRKARDFLREILAGRVGPGEFERLLVAKSEAYQELVRRTEPAPRPGIQELVARATALGFRCGIASATPESDIRHVLDRIGLTSRFDVIVSSDAVPRPKPAPDVYLRAAELLHVLPAHCIVVEDTPTGLAAGRAAGMHCVAFSNQWTAALDFAGAEIVVPSLDTRAIDRILGLTISANHLQTIDKSRSRLPSDT
ncbi:MAG TPA: HAD-IA family hydrolase, partial [Herpetosiphonaceae bacterium]|nr:HAD-IA family hydrolase [Herpetosiphonaceae bacterium]